MSQPGRSTQARRSITRSATHVLCTALVLLGLCGSHSLSYVSASPLEVPTSAKPLPPGCLAFQSNRSGVTQVYVMSTTGGTPRAVTNDIHGGFDPRWSPDGQRLAFITPSASNPYLYAISVLGPAGTQQLTDTGAGSYSPVWSPDEKRIAFLSGTAEVDKGKELYVVNTDGSGLIRLSDPLAMMGGPRGPRWSPDGSSIAFVGAGGDYLSWEIYVAKTDGSGVSRLTNNNEQDFNPNWSADGTRLAFESTRRSAHPWSSAYSIKADGSDLRLLTDLESHMPAWSPDGTQIALALGEDPLGDQEVGWPIAVLPSNGTELKRLGSAPYVVAGLDWSPDSSVIYWFAQPWEETSTPPTGFQVLLIPREGGEIVNLTSEYGVDSFPSWSSAPCPSYFLISPAVITTPPTEMGEATVQTFEGSVGGTGPVGATVRVFRRLGDTRDSAQPDGQEIGHAQVDAAGNWELKNVGLEFGVNTFVAVAELNGASTEPSNAVRVTKTRPVADSYGFKYRRLGVEFPKGGADTRASAEAAADLLNAAGFNSAFHENDSAEHAFAVLPHDDVFFVAGHGSSDPGLGVWFEDEAGNVVGLTKVAMDLTNQDRFPHLKLAVFLACESGGNVNGPESILSAFHDRGATTVVGFSRTIGELMAPAWNRAFWKYLLEDGLRVQDAAYAAVDQIPFGESGRWLAGIDRDSIVIVGDPNLRLGGVGIGAGGGGRGSW